VPADPNIEVVKPQEVMKYIKNFVLNIKPKVKTDDKCYENKKFKDRGIKL